MWKLYEIDMQWSSHFFPLCIKLEMIPHWKHNCYGLLIVFLLQHLYAESPNLQYLRMWLCLEMGPSKKWLSWNKTIRVDPNLIWLVSL